MIYSHARIAALLFSLALPTLVAGCVAIREFARQHWN